ncbi:rifin [Plasmodium sp. gorilla clade G1]|nr:rifin [Plasmodium sp. gorilla clade G1]
MKFHCFNIFLFYHSLNILLLSSHVNNKRNHYIKPHTSNTKATKSHRSLCEFELYAPANYDNDPEMKEVLDNFDRQTSQRFEEYNERMIKNRQKCKEQWDKDNQKIILKDKIQKELTKKLGVLQPDIPRDAISTCTCEKSISDKTGNFCLNCGHWLGSNVPLVGLMSGIAFYRWAIKYAVECGISEGAKAAASEAVKVAINLLTDRIPGLEGLLKGSLDSIVTKNMNSPMHLGMALHDAVGNACSPATPASDFVQPATCNSQFIQQQHLSLKVIEITGEASEAAKQAGAVAGKAAQGKAWSAAFTWENFLSSPLGISIIVTVCIVVMLIIIYLILRYRRKKKMKKKLQYIKLLKE